MRGFYRRNPTLHRKDFSHEGFQWIDCNDVRQSTLSLMRFGDKPEDDLIVICNFIPVPRPNYRVGVSFEGFWEECLNSGAGPRPAVFHQHRVAAAGDRYFSKDELTRGAHRSK